MLCFKTQKELHNQFVPNWETGENLSERRGSRVDNDSSLFTIVRADGWKNKKGPW